MRKGRDGGKKKRGEKNGGGKKEKTDGNSGHYVIASSRPPERRPLERLTPVPEANHISLWISQIRLTAEYCNYENRISVLEIKHHLNNGTNNKALCHPLLLYTQTKI